MFDIVTIGTATRDVFLKSTDFKILNDSKHLEKLGFPTGEAACFALGSKLEVEPPIFTTGGGAANAAVAFSRLGLKTSACIRVGDDDSGKVIVQELKDAGVRVVPSFAKNKATAYSTVLLTGSGERTILVYRGAGEHISENDIPFSSLSAQWAYIAPGRIPPAVMQKIILFCKKKNMRIVMNPSRGYLSVHDKVIRSILRHVDVLLVNREEAAHLTGLSRSRDEKLVRGVFDIIESGIAVVTEDLKGAIATDGSFVYRAGIFENVHTIDETGAGDAFGAGFIAGLIEKNDILYALRLASANAASVVEYIGATAGTLTKRDFKKDRWQQITLDIEKD